MRLDMFPDQPPLRIGDVGAQDMGRRVDPSDDWDAVRAKVSNAMAVSLFTDSSEDYLEALEELFKKDSDSE